MAIKRNLLILGAGFSKGLMGFPTVGDFFRNEMLDKVFNSYPFLSLAIKDFIGNTFFTAPPFAPNQFDKNDLNKYLSRFTLEDVWDRILYGIYNSEPGFIQEDWIKFFRELLGEEIKKENRISKKFYTWLRDHDPKTRRNFASILIAADWELKKLVLETYQCASLSKEKIEIISRETGIEELLKNKDSRLDIISFNYDILIEMYLKACDIKFSYDFDDVQANLVRIFKPHGSLNWMRTIRVDLNGEFKYDIINRSTLGLKSLSFLEMGFKYVEDKDFVGYDYEESGILPVIYEKEGYYYHFLTEKFFNTSKPERTPPDSETFKFFRMKQPNAIEKTLTECQAVKIIGYSFPNADAAIRKIFSKVKTEREKLKSSLEEFYWNLFPSEGRNKGEWENDLTERANALFYMDNKNIKINPDGFNVR